MNGEEVPPVSREKIISCLNNCFQSGSINIHPTLEGYAVNWSKAAAILMLSVPGQLSQSPK